MPSKTHDVKVLREFFDAILDGSKLFEVREDDRGYAVGDLMRLREWDASYFPPPHFPDAGNYTGREVIKTITYKLPGGKFGIDPNYCVLGLGIEE